MAPVGRHYRFRKLEFWPERGLIHVIDERFPPSHESAYRVVMVRDFLIRMNQFSTELKKRTFKYADEREEYVTLLDNAVECIQTAKSQGRPDDPKAVADMIRHRRRSMLYSSLPVGMRLDGAVLIDPMRGTWNNTSGALSGDFAPENVLLPPMPQAPPNKPITKWSPD